MSPLELELDTFAAGEQDALEAYSFAEETIEEYEQLGIATRHRPMVEDVHAYPGLNAGSYYDGRMPSTLKQLTLDELSATLSMACNWHGYIAAQYANVMVMRSEAKARKESIWSIVRNNYRKLGLRWKTKFSDQKLSDFARQDTRFIAANAEYEKLNAMYQTLGALAEVTEREMAAVSREVTIRQAKIEAEARARGIRNRSGLNPATVALPAERRRRVDANARDKTPAKVKRKHPAKKPDKKRGIIKNKFRPIKGSVKKR